MFGVQEGLELPEDEEEKKKTEADKEKFGGLCKVFFQTTCRIFFLNSLGIGMFSWH